MNNRNPIKQWEITFSQTDLERQALIDALPPSSYSICAMEEHANGGFHLHCGVKLKHGISFKKLREYIIAKFPDDYHRIHMSAIRDWNDFIDYCKKEDPNPVINGTLAKRVSAVVKEALELLENNDQESWPDYLARIRKERQDVYDAYRFYETDLPAWKRKWALEEEKMRLANLDPLDLAFAKEFFDTCKAEDFHKFLSNWEPSDI